MQIVMDRPATYAERHTTHNRRWAQSAATPTQEVSNCHDDLERRRGEHGNRIVKERDENVADQRRADEAAKSADRREPPHVAAYARDRRAQHPHDERTRHREEG